MPKYFDKFRLFFVYTALLTCVAMPLHAMRIDPGILLQPPESVAVDPSIRAASTEGGWGIRFQEGAITAPVGANLHPQSGKISFAFRVGENWNEAEERVLLWMGNAAGAHISITAASRTVTARYDNGTDEPAVVAFRSWRAQPGERFALHFAWAQHREGIICWLADDETLHDLAPTSPMAGLPETMRIGHVDSFLPWDGALEFLEFSPVATLPEEMTPGERTIAIHGVETEGELYRFWHVANFALRDSYTFGEPGHCAMLLQRAPFTREVLIDFTLGGRWRDGEENYHGIDPDGSLITDFSPMLRRIRNAIDAGFKPWIMLEKVPIAMSDPPQWHSYGNTAPAADNSLWYRFVKKAVESMIEAFGRETVASWEFLVATEPDLHPAHWAGTREEFFAHMDHAINAFVEVLPEGSISPGNILNPAFAYEYRDQWGTDAVAEHVRARDHWGLDIIDHAATGTNSQSGTVGTRMDFLSASWYIRVGMDNDGFDRAVLTMRSRLDRYPQFQGLPIDIREFGVLSDEQGRRLFAGDTSEWSASFYASIAKRVYTHGVRLVFEWDHATLGVLHPRGNVIGMLERMTGGEQLAVEVSDAVSAADCDAIAVRKDARLFVLVFHHRAHRYAKATETVHLEILDPAMRSGRTWRLSEWTVDAEHTVWTHAFNNDAHEAGLKPLPRAGRHEGNPARYYGDDAIALFQQKIDKYQRIAQLPQTRRDAELPVDDGRARIEIAMPAHSVRLLEISPP